MPGVPWQHSPPRTRTLLLHWDPWSSPLWWLQPLWARNSRALAMCQDQLTPQSSALCSCCPTAPPVLPYALRSLFRLKAPQRGRPALWGPFHEACATCRDMTRVAARLSGGLLRPVRLRPLGKPTGTQPPPLLGVCVGLLGPGRLIQYYRNHCPLLNTLLKPGSTPLLMPPAPFYLGVQTEVL